jgi:hypothetical protein
MEKIEQILSNFNCQKRIENLKLTFEEIESIIGFTLPSDYKFFAENYLEFEESIGQEYLRHWDFNEIVKINMDYQIFENLPKTLGIGTNADGEFIALEQTQNETFRIVLSPFIDLDKQFHIEIGDSFTDFLGRLNKDQSWFK